MNSIRHYTPLCLFLALTLLIFSSCKKFEGDITVPAYLHLDAFQVVPQGIDAPSVEAGFYTADIDAVQLTCYIEGDTAETVIGEFQLPCTVPLLREGTLKYLIATPLVKQNGISGTRIPYPYYQPQRFEGVRVAPDSVTHLGTQDPATRLWTITTHYYDKKQFDILVEDYFEPTAFATNFDQGLVWVKDDPANACTGQGYGAIYLTSADSVKLAHFNPAFTAEKTQCLYLEMDYWTDVELELMMVGYEINGEAASTLSVMRLYPNNGWQKIYINLGRAWSLLNYNTPIWLYFSANNYDRTKGRVRLDNVKIVAI